MGRVHNQHAYKPLTPILTTARSEAGMKGHAKKHTEEHGVSLATKLEETMDTRFKPRPPDHKAYTCKHCANQVGRMGI